VAFQFPQTGAQIQLDYVEKEINLPWHYAFFLFVMVLSGPVYFVWTIFLLRRYGVRILRKLSDVENVNLYWLRNLVIVFGIIWTSLMIIALVHHAMFLFSTDFCTNGLFASLAVFIVLIGYYGLKQQVIITSAEPQITRQRYASSVLQKETAQQYLQELEHFMESEKPFLEESITLQQLAEKTKIPAHYLSQVINEYRRQNFFDFVNTYRVNFFIEKMNDPHYSGYTLLGIAFESGFSSKTSFNRVFKKITGYPPGEYKKKHSS
jgi:AraC-like DNA-binding protein